MSPTLNHGTKITIQKRIWKYPKLKVGDIVVFKKNALTMIKRISQIENDRYSVKGDNWQQSTDSDDFGSIDREDILGKVIMSYSCSK